MRSHKCENPTECDLSLCHLISENQLMYIFYQHDTQYLQKIHNWGTLHSPSDVYVRSFLCPFSYFTKTLQKLLSDQAWSLVPKLNHLL